MSSRERIQPCTERQGGAAPPSLSKYGRSCQHRIAGDIASLLRSRIAVRDLTTCPDITGRDKQQGVHHRDSPPTTGFEISPTGVKAASRSSTSLSPGNPRAPDAAWREVNRPSRRARSASVIGRSNSVSMDHQRPRDETLGPIDLASMVLIRLCLALRLCAGLQVMRIKLTPACDPGSLCSKT